MSIREGVQAAFKQARLERDTPTKNVIGMLKTKVLNELKAGKGAEETDELWLKVLGSYAKQLKKSIEQFETLGERGAEPLAEAQFELAFCERFLPKKLDEAATRTLVEGIISENGISDMKQMGQLMGLVMKNHKDEVDAGIVNRIARELLS
jgi:uncharacterized protein YqeY